MAAYEEEDDDYYFVVAATAYEDDDDDEGFAIAASSEEDDDDDYVKVITTTTFEPPPLPLPFPPPSSAHLSAAAIAPSSPEPYDFVPTELQISPSSSLVRDVAAAAALWQQGAAAIDDAVPAAHQPFAFRFGAKREVVSEAMYGDGDEEEEEEEDENEDDYRYQGYYDLADRGRARHVKRSSGRRGRTKKASAMGRPRGDVRQAHCSVNL